MTEQPIDPGGPDDGREQRSALFSALADEHRREVLRYFQTSDDPVASVDDLVDDAIGRNASPANRDRLALAYHHAVLPRLAEWGFVDYDARTQTVRYRENPVLERTLRLVAETGAVPS